MPNYARNAWNINPILVFYSVEMTSGRGPSGLSVSMQISSSNVRETIKLFYVSSLDDTYPRPLPEPSESSSRCELRLFLQALCRVFVNFLMLLLGPQAKPVCGKDPQLDFASDECHERSVSLF